MDRIHYWMLARTVMTRSYPTTFGFGSSQLGSLRELLWDRQDQAFILCAKDDLLQPMRVQTRIPCSLLQAADLFCCSKQYIAKIIAPPPSEEVTRLHTSTCESLLYTIEVERTPTMKRRLIWQFYSPEFRAQRIVMEGDLLTAFLGKLNELYPYEIMKYLRRV